MLPPIRAGIGAWPVSDLADVSASKHFILSPTNGHCWGIDHPSLTAMRPSISIADFQSKTRNRTAPTLRERFSAVSCFPLLSDFLKRGEPAVRSQEAPQTLILGRKGGKPPSDLLTLPPGT
jgi:hypothetical protein